jgi:GT2 family glycosyltransferase
MSSAGEVTTTSAPLDRRLTVVLLTYNCAHRISPILDHLMSLGVPIVAVDNASTDGTPDVLAERDDIELVRLPDNIGAAARNVGAERAHTPYLLFCDDDGWYEPDGLAEVCDLFDDHPQLAVVNACIVVGRDRHLDPISAVMEASPLPDRHGIPGSVLFSFMAGACAVRATAYKEAGGYDARFFIGGEEETLAVKLAKAGWQMRYRPSFVMHHAPSRANAGGLRAFGLRNTLVNAWLHRRAGSAARWTAFVLADAPKNREYLRGVWLTLRALPWIVRERDPMDGDLDAQLSTLDRRRFAERRPLLTRRDWRPADAGDG